MESIIASRIRELRIVRGFSQEYMAIKLDISQRAYSKIELNQTKLSLKKINEIAKIFGTSIWDLLNINKPIVPIETEKNDINHSNIYLLDDLIQKYDIRIKTLEDEIKRLKKSPR